MALMTIIVEFETNPGAEAEFLRVIKDHAARTLHEEPGCLRFDVAEPLGEDGQPIAGRVLVSELYADMDAVAAHRANPRMPTLGANLKPLVKSRRLILAQSVMDAPEDQGIRPEQLNASNDD